MVRQRSVLAILPTGAISNRGTITVKAVFACACTWSSKPLPVGLRSQTALTVILLGFNNGRAGRMVLFACALRDYGTQPGAAGPLGLRTAGRRRGYRTKASGPQLMRRVPRRAPRARLQPERHSPVVPRTRSRVARRAARSARP